MPILPSTPIQVEITAVTADTFEPVVGGAVELQQYDPSIGDFRPVQSLRTGPGGVARASFNAPREPGTYRYRSAFTGTPDLRSDRSPEVRVTIGER